MVEKNPGFVGKNLSGSTLVLLNASRFLQKHDKQLFDRENKQTKPQ
jgi:hypothetical protein